MNNQKLTTLVKLLNGDLFTVDHHPGSGESGLKNAIQGARPELFSECQILTYPDPEDKRFVFVGMDTVTNAVSIELLPEHVVIVHDKPSRIINFDISNFMEYANIFKQSPTNYSCNIKCFNIILYWKSIYDTYKHSYTISIFYHPQKGFTSDDMMHDDYVEVYDGGRFGNEYQKWFVPKEANEKKIWFPTFRSLLDALHLKNKPAIYSSEDFLDKVEDAFRAYIPPQIDHDDDNEDDE